MAEEVKINVNAGGDVTIISDAEKKLRALKAEQLEFEKHGAPQTAASKQKQFDKARAADLKLQQEIIESSKAEATAVRASGDAAGAAVLEEEIELREEALRLQRAGIQYESEALGIARQKIASQAELNEELAAAAALEKGESGGGGGAGGIQSSGLRGGRLGQALRFGGVNLRTAGEIGFAAMIGEMAKRMIDTMADEMDSASLEAQKDIRHGRREDEKRVRKIQGATGASERSGLIEGDKDEIESLTDQIDAKKLEISKAERSWLGLLGMNRPQIAAMKGQVELAEQKRDKISGAIPKQEDLRKNDIDDEIALSEARGRHDGREVRSIEEKLAWTKKYNEEVKNGAKSWQAAELAGMETFQKRQEQMQGIAAHLVSARSGAGDIARAAAFADSNSSLRKSIDSLHATVKAHGEAATRRNFAG